MKKKMIALLAVSLLALSVPAFAADNDTDTAADNSWGCWRSNTQDGSDDARGGYYCGGGHRGWHHRQ
ncbi:hypothetical protein SAMN02910356_01962 [Selenomonas sp. GACV-9]|uniref:hypothetical protein n=1 Tax=Selenomonas sp. GACV-9 TaxID=3158782 RepID=UPI0008F29FDC|nr:hypothetical protein SAMN02910356_01962 [Selenomonas ruminantium]